MSELKPCPFCGGEAEFAVFNLRHGSERGQMRCKTKGCQGRAIAHHFNKEQAIEAWNKRI